MHNPNSSFENKGINFQEIPLRILIRKNDLIPNQNLNFENHLNQNISVQIQNPYNFQNFSKQFKF